MSDPEANCTYAPTDLPRYAGANTSFTKVSIEVGVEFAADRGSVAVTIPLLIPWNISMKLATVFAGAPSAPAPFPPGHRESVHSANPAWRVPWQSPQQPQSKSSPVRPGVPGYVSR